MYTDFFKTQVSNNRLLLRIHSCKAKHKVEYEWLMQQYPLYNSYRDKVFAVANGGYRHCEVCGNIMPFNNNLFCSRKCYTESDRMKEVALLLHSGESNIKRQKAFEQYGGNPMKCDTVKSKVSTWETNFSTKYGSDNPLSQPEVRKKRKHTMIERYGSEHALQNPDLVRKAVGKANTTRERVKRELLDSIEPGLKQQMPIGRHLNFVDTDMILIACGVSSPSIDIIRKNYVNWHHHAKEYGLKLPKSIYEKDICDYLDELGIAYITNTRKVIAPQELDIFIPSHNLAIEINGHHWHDSNNGTNRTYHYDKTNKCLEQGIQLLHFWDYEIDNKPDLIKSIIKSKLGLNKRLYARKLKVNRVGNTQAKEFLNNNHLNGHTPAKHTLGLYDNDTLVMVLSYGSSRFEKGATEIIRIASSQGITVVGGVSKLLKHARLKGRIVSYADRRISNGNVYYELGFKYLHTTKYGYHYYDGKRCYSRQQCQKKRLSKLYGLDMSLTEQEMTKLLGYKMLCDAGHMKFELS